MEKEIWKDIKGYEGLYAVSNLGRVVNLKKGRKIMKFSKRYNGSLCLRLQYKSKGKGYLIQYLVAKAFIPNPENKKYVVHLNDNNQDNRVENLLWSDVPCNVFHNRKKVRKVAQFETTGEFIREYPSIIACEKDTCIPSSLIWKCCNDKIKTTWGYTFKYID